MFESICITEKRKNLEGNGDYTGQMLESSFSDMQEDSDEEIIEIKNYEKPTSCLQQQKVQLKATVSAESEKPKINETISCDKRLPSYKRSQSIKKHNVQNVNEKEKKYGICPYCGDRYALSSLSLHIRRHTGEKPYKCDVCEKAFVELHDLKRHKRMHTGEKPHVCPTCGKAFSQQNKLARHKLVHTGERPYKCEQCEKAFSQRNELNLHIRRHTGAKPYTCGICGESFITGTFLRNHQKSVSHFEEDKEDRFIKIRVTNPSRSYRNRGNKKVQN